MTFPYIIEKDNAVVCVCKGCGDELWREYINERGNRCKEISERYGDLYIALVDEAGVLSEHSTPACPDCAQHVLDGNDSCLGEWWGADVFHWFIEERVLGKDPDTAYRVANKLEGGRRPVRALRYDAARTVRP